MACVGVQSGQLEVSVMERVLVQLRSMPHLLAVPALTTAWTTLIAHPFTKGVYVLHIESLVIITGRLGSYLR